LFKTNKNNIQNMATLFCDIDSQQSWARTDQTDGFFPGGMSPFVAFQDERKETGAVGPPHMQLGPRGPLPPMQPDDVVMSLIKSLAMPVATPMATPVATPVATPMATPMATPTPSPIGSPKRWRVRLEHELRNELVELGEAQEAAYSVAAFLPPEFYLDAHAFPVTPTKMKGPDSLESNKRSKSPQTETEHFLGKACFFLPTRKEPHLNECDVTEIEMQTLGLLDEEMMKMMRTIVV